MELDIIIKKKIENYYKEIDEIPEKSLARIVLAEKIIESIEIENEVLIDKIKKNELTISFFAEEKKLGITRKSIYSDKYLLQYLSLRIKEKKDYFNTEKIEYLNEKYKDLEKDYNKILDNIIDRFDVRMQLDQYRDEVKDLLEEKEKFLLKIKEKEDIINNLNNALKSYKITKIK